MSPKIQIMTNEYQEELKEHGTYELPILVSDEALSRFYIGSFQWHQHTEIELVLIIEGTMVYQTNDRVSHPRARQTLFGNSNIVHIGHMADDHGCKHISTTLHPQLLYDYQGSRIASWCAGPLTGHTALPVTCFDLSEEQHRKAVGPLEDIIRINGQRHETYEMGTQTDLYCFWKLLYLHCCSDPEPIHAAVWKNQK